MRFPTAYYLMLLYLTVMLKSLLPTINDAVSHTFSEAEHLATVHAKYGDNHLESALARTESDSDNSKNQNTVKTTEPVPVHISEDECMYDFSSTGQSLQAYEKYYNDLLQPVYGFSEYY